MYLAKTSEDMVEWSSAQRALGLTIGIVPTMGFLHRGHASLMANLRPRVDKLVVSIYVNPLQFGPNEDLDAYPRDPEGDTAICTEEGVDCLFMPDSLYPPGFTTSISVHQLMQNLCATSRPGHMEGVATVCTRLFNLSRATHACFGEKDFQQLMMLRRLVTDLAIPVSVVPGALVREEGGLAMSSRNKYLSDHERIRAQSLSRSVYAIQAACEAGVTDAKTLLATGRGGITCDRLDYLELVDAETLQPIHEVGDRPARALVAAFYRTTRLIDNVAIGPELKWT
ncbi:MAG: pantoate--beta-alanine ligase [Rhodobacterales bacterium]|nr:pantoate--beta-alanine ligase [Rhodobacterales bacterium]